jgi:hypothetical protein
VRRRALIRRTIARMREAHVQFVNDSDAVSDAAARRIVRALGRQAREHFAPAWGIRAEVELVPRHRVAAGAWVIAIVDSARSGDALGWHELTAAGLPLGKVYAVDSSRADGSWSITASHELLELLADPDMTMTVLDDSGRARRLYAYEVCDPVQDDRFAYALDGVRVSDFVLPAWFESFHRPRSVRFDHAGACTRPLQVTAGGYASVYHVDGVRGWRDLGPSRGATGHARGSRHRKRRLTRQRWRLSTRGRP